MYINHMEENLLDFAGTLGEWTPLVIATLCCLFVSVLLVKSVKALLKLMKEQRRAEDEYFYRSKDGISFVEIDGNYRVVNGFLVKLNKELMYLSLYLISHFLVSLKPNRSHF